MYQIEHQTTTTTNKEINVLCHRLTESLSSIYVVKRISTMLGLSADTVADLIAPLGITNTATTNKGADIPGLEMLLHTAKVVGFVEEYTISLEPSCLGKPLTVIPEGHCIVITLPSGWLVELDMPGATQACVRDLSHSLHVEPWN